MISRDDRREAESQIARLIHTYLYRLDEGDLEAVAAFFEDATWHVSPELATRGKVEKLAWLRERPPRRREPTGGVARLDWSRT